MLPLETSVDLLQTCVPPQPTPKMMRVRPYMPQDEVSLLILWEKGLGKFQSSYGKGGRKDHFFGLTIHCCHKKITTQVEIPDIISLLFIWDEINSAISLISRPWCTKSAVRRTMMGAMPQTCSRTIPTWWETSKYMGYSFYSIQRCRFKL